LGCLLLNLLLESHLTIDIDLLSLLENELKGKHKCGWKSLTEKLSFSNLTVPQKKSSPSTQKETKEQFLVLRERILNGF